MYASLESEWKFGQSLQKIVSQNLHLTGFIGKFKQMEHLRTLQNTLTREFLLASIAILPFGIPL